MYPNMSNFKLSPHHIVSLHYTLNIPRRYQEDTAQPNNRSYIERNCQSRGRLFDKSQLFGEFQSGAGEFQEVRILQQVQRK